MELIKYNTLKCIGSKAIFLSFYVTEISNEIFCSKSAVLRIIYQEKDYKNNK